MAQASDYTGISTMSKPEDAETCISDRLKAILALKGLSTAEAARRLNVPYRTLQSYLLKQHVPSVETLVGFCIEFGANGHWLLTGNGAMFMRPEEELSAEYIKVTKALIFEAARLAEETLSRFNVEDRDEQRPRWIAQFYGLLAGNLAKDQTREIALNIGDTVHVASDVSAAVETVENLVRRTPRKEDLFTPGTAAQARTKPRR